MLTSSCFARLLGLLNVGAWSFAEASLHHNHHRRQKSESGIKVQSTAGAGEVGEIHENVTASTPIGTLRIGTPFSASFHQRSGSKATVPDPSLSEIKVIYDTGSNQLVIKSWLSVENEVAHWDPSMSEHVAPKGEGLYNARLSRSYRLEGDGASNGRGFISYGSGEAETREGRETIHIAGSELFNFPFSEIASDSLHVLHAQGSADGVLGLQHMKNTSRGSSLFSYLRQTGSMHSFSFCNRKDYQDWIWHDQSTQGTKLPVVGNIHWAVNLEGLRMQEVGPVREVQADDLDEMDMPSVQDEDGVELSGAMDEDGMDDELEPMGARGEVPESLSYLPEAALSAMQFLGLRSKAPRQNVAPADKVQVLQERQRSAGSTKKAAKKAQRKVQKKDENAGVAVTDLDAGVNAESAGELMVQASANLTAQIPVLHKTLDFLRTLQARVDEIMSHSEETNDDTALDLVTDVKKSIMEVLKKVTKESSQFHTVTELFKKETEEKDHKISTLAAKLDKYVQAFQKLHDGLREEVAHLETQVPDVLGQSCTADDPECPDGSLCMDLGQSAVECMLDSKECACATEAASSKSENKPAPTTASAVPPDPDDPVDPTPAPTTKKDALLKLVQSARQAGSSMPIELDPDEVQENAARLGARVFTTAGVEEPRSPDLVMDGATSQGSPENGKEPLGAANPKREAVLNDQDLLDIPESADGDADGDSSFAQENAEERRSDEDAPMNREEESEQELRDTAEFESKPTQKFKDAHMHEAAQGQFSVADISDYDNDDLEDADDDDADDDDDDFDVEQEAGRSLAEKHAHNVDAHAREKDALVEADLLELVDTVDDDTVKAASMAKRHRQMQRKNRRAEADNMPVSLLEVDGSPSAKNPHLKPHGGQRHSHTRRKKGKKVVKKDTRGSKQPRQQQQLRRHAQPGAALLEHQEKVARLTGWLQGLKEMSSKAVQNPTIPLCERTEDPASGCVGVIDSGSNILAMPHEIALALTRQANVNPDCSNFHDLPDIYFSLGDGFKVTLPGSSYVMKIQMPEWAAKTMDALAEEAARSAPDDGASLLAMSDVNNPWVLTFEEIHRSRGLDFRASLADLSLAKLRKKTTICVPAITTLDVSTAKGRLFVLGTPLMERYYTRWSWLPEDESPSVFLHDIDDAEACRARPERAPPSIVRREPQSAQKPAGPEQVVLSQVAQRSQAIPVPQPNALHVDQIGFPHWAHSLHGEDV